MHLFRNLKGGKKESVSSSSGLQTIEVSPEDKKLQLSKELLDFGLSDTELMPVNQPIFDTLDLYNCSPKKLKYSFDPAWPAQCELTFDPTNGSLDKGKNKKIKVKLIINTPVNVKFRLAIRVDGGEAYFVNLRIRCELGVFGVDPTELECVEDLGYSVPKILVQMKSSLVVHEGLKQEGIFRLAGDQTEVQKVKAMMNQSKSIELDHDPNTVATLLKIWFRELPTPILNSLSKECIYDSDDMNKCQQAVEGLSVIPKTLLDWLLELLVQTCSYSNINKMTAQNLAIVVAPNLYEPPGADPMEGLVMSQKSVQFLLNLIQYKIESKTSAS